MLTDRAPNRLKWRCRRGMRELDVLLGRYLSERWPSATPVEQAAFEAFLELPDPEIYDLCLRRAVSETAAFERLADILTGSTELNGSAVVNQAKDGRPASGEPQT
ncbi:MAG: succinate dehydrogenase assembly factor 2 [Pseudomonadota bacterium]